MEIEEAINQAGKKELERLEEIIWRKIADVNEESEKKTSKRGKHSIGKERAKELMQEILLEMQEPDRAPSITTKAKIIPFDRGVMRRERKDRGY